MTMKTDKAIIAKEGVDALINLSLLMTCFSHAILPKMIQFNEALISWDPGGGTGTNLAMSFSATNPEPKHYQAAISQLAGYMKDISEGKLASFVDQKTFDMLQTSTLHSLQNSMKSSPISQALTKMHHMLLNMHYPVPE